MNLEKTTFFNTREWKHASKHSPLLQYRGLHLSWATGVCYCMSHPLLGRTSWVLTGGARGSRHLHKRKWKMGMKSEDLTPAAVNCRQWNIYAYLWKRWTYYSTMHPIYKRAQDMKWYTLFLLTGLLWILWQHRCGLKLRLWNKYINLEIQWIMQQLSIPWIFRIYVNSCNNNVTFCLIIMSFEVK